MRFLDTSIVVSATLKPKRELTAQEQVIKMKAREVFDRIGNGERVGTTVLHIIEIENMLKSRSIGGLPEAQRVVKVLLVNPAVQIVDVSSGMLRSAFGVAERTRVNLSDSVGWLVMRDILKTVEAHAFDADFKKLDSAIVVLP